MEENSSVKFDGKQSFLIGFAGPVGSGKTTAAKATGFKRTYFAEPLKKCVRDLFLFSDEQLYTLEGKEAVDARWGKSPREIMQHFGTEYIRANFDNFWVRRMAMELLNLRTQGFNNIVIDDVRFENEAAMIRGAGGVVIHIDRPGPARTSKSDHASEQPLRLFKEDVILVNHDDHQEDFESNVKELVAHYFHRSL